MSADCAKLNDVIRIICNERLNMRKKWSASRCWQTYWVGFSSSKVNVAINEYEYNCKNYLNFEDENENALHWIK